MPAQKPQNRLVDVCEKIQLQAQRIEKFIEQTLSVKEQKLQVRCDTLPTTLQHTHNSSNRHTSDADTALVGQLPGFNSERSHS